MLPLLEPGVVIDWEPPAVHDMRRWSEEELDDAARQCLEALAGRRRARRSLFPQLERVVRAAGTRVVSDLLAALRTARDPEALNVLESLAGDLEGGFLTLLGRELLDPAQPERYRCRLARAVANLEAPREQKLPLLMSGMSDPLPAVRGACAEAAGYAGLTEASARLKELAASDPDAYVREAAAQALEDLDS
ncbi:MAG: HEAT repeat domain-containing protein [Candidatus Eremiobacterota bacterium]